MFTIELREDRIITSRGISGIYIEYILDLYDFLIVTDIAVIKTINDSIAISVSLVYIGVMDSIYPGSKVKIVLR